MLVCLCAILQWSGAPAVRCPGSGDTQRDSTRRNSKSPESCGSSHADCIQGFTSLFDITVPKQQPFQWNLALELRTYVRRSFQILSHNAAPPRRA